MARKTKQIVVRPVGIARIDEDKGIYQVHVHERFRPALKELDAFTHVNILWWAHEHDTPAHRAILQVDELPPFYGDDAPVMGVFATRSEYRPNPVALTSASIASIDHETGIITLNYFDAFDGTPIIDLKPYLPMTDRLASAGYPTYLSHWPASNEDAVAWWARYFEENA